MHAQMLETNSISQNVEKCLLSAFRPVLLPDVLLHHGICSDRDAKTFLDEMDPRSLRLTGDCLPLDVKTLKTADILQRHSHLVGRGRCGFHP
jgi:hypothetical protein